MRIYLSFFLALSLAACNASGRGSNVPYRTDANKAVPGTYVVVPGDTVSGIAERTNVSVLSIIELNRLEPPFIIHPGQVLKISGETQPDAAPVAAIGVKKLTPPSNNNIQSEKPIAAQTEKKVAGAQNLNNGNFKPQPRPLGSPLDSNADANAVTANPPPGFPQPVGGNAGGKPKSSPQPQFLSEPGSSFNPGPSSPNANSGNQNQIASAPVGTAVPSAPAPAKTSSGISPGAPAPLASPPAASAQQGSNQEAQPAIFAPPAPAPAPVQEASVDTTAPAPNIPETLPSRSVLPPNDGKAVFLWPVKGQIIAKFGADAQGLKNDGINISAPLGTPVKAAGDGIVAYAGNELRGFGNLILIKHNDGWITAYAHNETLMVKKGDSVKRGQQIAKVGQTGNVSSPQLHFEVRKGAQAVDPLPKLGGQT